jgi:hypothetical protein
MTAQVAQDNVALVKRGYEAFGKGDLPALQALYHADATFSTVPASEGDGNYRGRDEILAYFGKLFAESKGTFRATPMSISAAGERVFVLQALSGERKGYALHETSVMVFTIDARLVKDMREFVPPVSGIRAFWDA